MENQVKTKYIMCMCVYMYESGQKLNPMIILPHLGARWCIPDILTRMVGNIDHFTPQVLQLVAIFFSSK